MRGSLKLTLAVIVIGLVLAIDDHAFAQAQVQPVVVNGGGGTSPITTCVVGTVASGTCPMPVTVSGGVGATVTANQGTPNAGGATNSWPVQGAGVAGTPAGGVVSIQGVSSGTAVTTTESPAQRTIVALDISTVTTGGTAVTALTAGHRTAGGFLTNPKAATIDLCINEQGVASGTTSSGALTCIPPGGSYNLTPAAGAVSVITSDSSHPFSGQGLN